MIRNERSGPLVLIGFIFLLLCNEFAYGSQTPSSQQPNGSTTLDDMIFPRPINVLLANPTCKTLDQIAEDATGIPPTVTISPPPVDDGFGKLIPYDVACSSALGDWKRNNPGINPPYIPWPVQVMLIKQGAGLEWIMLANDHALRTTGVSADVPLKKHQ